MVVKRGLMTDIILPDYKQVGDDEYIKAYADYMTKLSGVSHSREFNTPICLEYSYSPGKHIILWDQYPELIHRWPPSLNSFISLTKKDGFSREELNSISRPLGVFISEVVTKDGKRFEKRDGERAISHQVGIVDRNTAYYMNPITEIHVCVATSAMSIDDKANMMTIDYFGDYFDDFPRQVKRNIELAQSMVKKVNDVTTERDFKGDTHIVFVKIPKM